MRAGLVVGSGGNLSAREPGADQCWVTGSGTWLDRLDRADFARVRIADGAPVSRPAPVPTSELALHLHPQSVLLLDALGERVRLVNTDHIYYLRPVERTGFHPPGSVALAQATAAAVSGGANCVILAHHGCSVLGSTVELAHRRVRNLEEAAQLTYRALTVGGSDLPECPPGWAGYPDPGGTAGPDQAAPIVR